MLAIVASCALAAAQEAAPTPGAGIDTEALAIDIDALVIADQLTTRCSLFQAGIDYLDPIEQVGANVHLGELTALLSNTGESVPDTVAAARADAAAIPCDDETVADYIDFGRQVARDVIDTAMLAWSEIDVAPCVYFADDDFMSAVERVREAAQSATVDGPDNRLRFLEQRADGWIEMFSGNCSNLYFDPVTTLPGQIALALPAS